MQFFISVSVSFNSIGFIFIGHLSDNGCEHFLEILGAEKVSAEANDGKVN